MAAPVELGLDAQAQTIDVREKRAEVRGKRAWEHGNRAIRQVDAATPRPRFGVERGAWGDVCTHVRDRDPRSVSAGLRALDPNRIVVIAGVLRIDGRQRKRAKVFASRSCGVGYLGSKR